MMTSKELLDQTGLSRATLNNYISLGLIPRPEVKRLSPAPGEPLTTLGYFPDWAVDRILQIRELKRAGLSMDAICNQLIGTKPSQNAAPEKILKDDTIQQIKEEIISEVVEEKRNTIFNNNKNQVERQESLNVSIDKIPYPAYMMNYECGLIWLNDAAQKTFFAKSGIPERAEERSLIPTLLSWSAYLSSSDKSKLFTTHFGAIKQRLSKSNLGKNLADLNSQEREWLELCYDQARTPEDQMLQESLITNQPSGDYRLITINFREGVLVTYVPTIADAGQLLEWLSQRDSVIRTLLSQRLPVLTPVAAMVADLQNSVRICSELPPEEYFQLINEIWSTLDPIFREYYGAYGKHTGDGMVYYFFPQPDRNYLMDSILCACKIRETMKKISHAWSLKKGWTNQLYMNIGLSEGEEWLGTFKTNTSYELVVLGETINVCGRLSDFSRFGKIWATKTLVSKLSHSERDLIEYGIQRAGLDQEVFVSNSYAQIGSLISKDDPRHAKLFEIESYAVTEIRQVKR